MAKFRTIVGSQINAGQKAHDEETKREFRRRNPLKHKWPFDIEQKQENVALSSERLGVRGILDLLIITSEGEFIPIEFKQMRSYRGQILLDHKYQLALLSLLVEENMSCVVRRGVVRYLLEERNILQNISSGMKRQTLTYVQKIRTLLDEGTVPPARRQCKKSKPGCGFADLCRDL